MPKKTLKNVQQAGATFLKQGNINKDKLVKALSVPIMDKVEKSIEFVDGKLGVSEVSEAQKDVSAKESSFLSSRAKVKEIELSLKELQDGLNKIRKKLDRTDRTNENYLSTVTDEHKLLLQVEEMNSAHKSAEDVERTNFVEFSSAVRLSHEKERSRVERTKYWSVIGSVAGTILGFFLSSAVSHYRLNGMKKLTILTVQEATSQINNTIEENFAKVMQEISRDEIAGNVLNSLEKSNLRVKDGQEDSEKFLTKNKLNDQTEELINLNKELIFISKDLIDEVKEVKKLFSIENNELKQTDHSPWFNVDRKSVDHELDSNNINLEYTGIFLLSSVAVILFGLMVKF